LILSFLLPDNIADIFARGPDFLNPVLNLDYVSDHPVKMDKKQRHFTARWLVVSWSLTSLFSTNMAISETTLLDEKVPHLLITTYSDNSENGGNTNYMKPN